MEQNSNDQSLRDAVRDAMQDAMRDQHQMMRDQHQMMQQMLQTMQAMMARMEVQNRAPPIRREQQRRDVGLPRYVDQPPFFEKLEAPPIRREQQRRDVGLPSCGARLLKVGSWLRAVRSSASSPCPSPPPPSPPSDVAGSETPPISVAAPSRSFFPKRGQTLELVCESLAFKGKGVCKVAGTGFVVMCDRALPGERFLGRVSRKKGNCIEVKKLKTIIPHLDLVEAPCEHASDYGGCKTQNLSYEAQLRAKEQQVHGLIAHVGRFSDKDPEFASVLKPIVPCDVQFHYRNKMEFSFGAQRWIPGDSLTNDHDRMESGYALGLHAPGFFDKVLQVEKCLLQSKAANKVLAIIQDSWRDPELGLSPYDVHTHTGFLKHLMIRTGRDVKTGLPELMINFVTSSYKPKLLEPLISKISTIPEVVSVMNNVNSSVGNTSVGEEEYTLYGKSTITEMLRGLTFQISANSFFQTNSHQAEVLYKLIEDCAGLKRDRSEIVLDLFCGTGTIGLTLAKRVKHVYGYEVVAEAVLNAQRNAELNNIHHLNTRTAAGFGLRETLFYRQPSFEVGDMVWVYLPRERYPQGAFTKQKPKKIVRARREFKLFQRQGRMMRTSVRTRVRVK